MLPHEDTVAALSEAWIREARQAQPSLLARLVARSRWFSLNERLISGEDPAGSAVLAAHAARLTARRRREEIADALRGLLRVAEQAPRVSRVAPDTSALLANEAAVRSAAQRLEIPAPVYARGVARLERLVTDSGGPVFRGGVAALEEQLSTAAAELRGAAPIEMAHAGEQARRGRRSPRRVGSRRIGRRCRARSGPGPTLNQGPVAGSSFALPNGSWFHGRRDSA